MAAQRDSAESPVLPVVAGANGAPDQGSAATAAALSDARGGQSGDPPKRKRRSKAELAASRGEGGGAQDAEEIQKQVAKLLDVEVFAGLVRLPADIGLILTGRKHFDLPADRVKPVAEKCQIAAAYWVSVDPKYLALLSVAVSLTALYAPVVKGELEYRKSIGVPVEGTP